MAGDAATVDRPTTDRILFLDASATGLLCVFALGAAIAPDEVEIALAAYAVLCFVIGVVAFLWAYAIAVGRSRQDLIGVGGLYFLTGDVAPRRERNWLRGLLVVQIVA